VISVLTLFPVSECGVMLLLVAVGGVPELSFAELCIKLLLGEHCS
jgi:hypothetical protein